jgi:RHS repeat-associated protein
MQALALTTDRDYYTRAANEDCINGGPRTRTKYLYDGSNFVQEQNAAGAATATLLTGGIDQLFARMTSAGISVPMWDALGSVIGETNSAQTVTTSFAFEPYGTTTQSGTSTGNSQQYTGRENDGTGIYYYRARYYNPSTARFISEDPIGFRGGTNIYAYAAWNPISYIDPLGLAVWDSYPTPEAAGIAGACEINGQSIEENTEYAGSVYQNSDGTYSYTPPSPGSENGSSPLNSLPWGGQIPNAWYHTHGAYDPSLGAGNYRYSPQDRYFSDITRKPNYLADPRNNVHRYDPDPLRKGRGTVHNYGQCGCGK